MVVIEIKWNKSKSIEKQFKRDYITYIMILSISIFIWAHGYFFKETKEESKGVALHQ